jgi:chaperonin cofactor prefoldin
MNDTQLYLAIGMPTIAILVGVLINGMQYHHATAALSARLTSVETRLDMLIGKVMEIDARLSRLEGRLEHRQ